MKLTQSKFDQSVPIVLANNQQVYKRTQDRIGLLIKIVTFKNIYSIAIIFIA